MPNPPTSTIDTIVGIAEQLGTLATVLNPAIAAEVAVITGIAEFLRGTVMPAIGHLQSHVLSIAEQATLAAESAAERARVGAPVAPESAPAPVPASVGS